MTITADQFKEAARKALDAGDIATARKLIGLAKAMESQAAPNEAPAASQAENDARAAKALGMDKPLTAAPNALRDGLTPRGGEADPALVAEIGDRARQREISTGQSFASGAVNGASFGFADEIGAAMVSPFVDGSYSDVRGVINQSHSDASTANPKSYVAGQVAGAVATPSMGLNGLAAKGATKLAKVGYGVLAGAAGGAIAGFGSGDGVADRVKSSAIGAGLGAVGGALAVPIGNALSWAAQKGGKALQRIMTDRRMFTGADFTDEGKATLQALGYNVDELTASFKQTFQKGIDDALTPQQAARAADMGEFGIPAYRANVTGLADDFATLERGRRGALGPSVEAQVGSAMNAQDAAMRDAGERVAMGMGGGGKLDQGDAASMAMTAARDAMSVAKKTAQSAYDELADMGAGVSGKSLKTIGSNMRRSLQVGGTFIDDAATPNAAATFKALDQTFAKAPKGAVPFMDLERARQAIVRNRASAYRGSLGPDQIAMDKVLGEFDQQLDNLMSSTLTEGDAGALEAAKKARGLWANYRQKFTGTGAASRFIQDMVDEDASPDQVVKWLFSSGKLGSGKFNSTIAKGVKDVIGPDSDAWGAIRQSAVRQIIEKPKDMTQMGPQALSERLGEFFSSPATRELANELFSKSEIAQLRRYQAALKRMVPPAGAVNHSGTAYEGARMARSAWQSVAATFGMSTGGLPGAAAAVAGGKAVQAGKGWLAARAIMSPTAPITTNSGMLPAQVGRLVGGSTTLQDQAQRR